MSTSTFDFVFETIITYHQQYMTVRWFFERTVLVVPTPTRLVMEVVLEPDPGEPEGMVPRGRRAVSGGPRPGATAG
jgi:hypothetical protein